MNAGYIFQKMMVGFRLRCPKCEQGEISTGLFNVHRKCPVCGHEFERRDGESLGAMMLNLCIVEMVAVFGFFGLELLTDIPLLPNAIFWLSVSIFGPLLLYRHTRGMWIAVVYLSEQQ